MRQEKTQIKLLLVLKMRLSYTKFVMSLVLYTSEVYLLSGHAHTVQQVMGPWRFRVGLGQASPQTPNWDLQSAFVQATGKASQSYNYSWQRCHSTEMKQTIQATVFKKESDFQQIRNVNSNKGCH